MKTFDPTLLSIKKLKSYHGYYKKRIDSAKASLLEYELFVKLEQELIKRRAAKRRVSFGGIGFGFARAHRTTT